jgi:hypothetical protein
MLSCPPATPTAAKSTVAKPTGSPAHSSVKLGWILINKRLISAAQLDAFLAQQHQCRQKLGNLLIEAKLISEQQLTQLLKEQYWRSNGYWVI